RVPRCPVGGTGAWWARFWVLAGSAEAGPVVAGRGLAWGRGTPAGPAKGSVGGKSVLADSPLSVLMTRSLSCGLVRVRTSNISAEIARSSSKQSPVFSWSENALVLPLYTARTNASRRL